MTTLHVPPLTQVEQMISECLKILPCGSMTEARREEITAACAGAGRAALYSNFSSKYLL